MKLKKLIKLKLFEAQMPKYEELVIKGRKNQRKLRRKKILKYYYEALELINKRMNQGETFTFVDFSSDIILGNVAVRLIRYKYKFIELENHLQLDSYYVKVIWG